jgi:hypothetical protein
MFRWHCRWLCRWLLPREISNQRLAARATAKKAKHVKKTHRQRECGKDFSHDGSPIDSVQYSANGHFTDGSFIRRDTRVYCRVVARRVECNNYIYNITLWIYISQLQTEKLQGTERLGKPDPPLGAGGLEWYKVRLDAREQKNANAQGTRPIAWPKAEVKPPPLHWMDASRASRQMAESIEKTQALDVLAQFAAAIDGALVVRKSLSVLCRGTGISLVVAVGGRKQSSVQTALRQLYGGV